MKVFGMGSFCGVAKKATPRKRPTGRQMFLRLVDFLGWPKKVTPQNPSSLPQLHYHNGGPTRGTRRHHATPRDGPT